MSLHHNRLIHYFERQTNNCLVCGQATADNQGCCPECEQFHGRNISTEQASEGYPFALNKDGHIVISWFEYRLLVNQLIKIVSQSNYEFNQIVAIVRGGFYVGDPFSRFFKVPLALLAAESYHEKEQQDIVFSRDLCKTKPGLGDKILLIDDLTETGITQKRSRDWLERHYGFQELKTAVLWHKETSEITPDFYVQFIPQTKAGTVPWIIQPFEQYEHQQFKKNLLHSTEAHIKLIHI